MQQAAIKESCQLGEAWEQSGQGCGKKGRDRDGEWWGAPPVEGLRAGEEKPAHTHTHTPKERNSERPSYPPANTENHPRLEWTREHLLGP